MEITNFLTETKMARLKSCSQNPESIAVKLLHMVKLFPGSKPSWQDPTTSPWLPTLSRDNHSPLEESDLSNEADWRHSKQAKGRKKRDRKRDSSAGQSS